MPGAQAFQRLTDACRSAIPSVFGFEHPIEIGLLLFPSMPIKVIEPRRLYLEIAGQIRSLIENREFPFSSRLPAERELAKQFGVSRPSVREALIALEVEGYVDVRPGSGVFVTKPKRQAPDYSNIEGPLEIMRARKVVEGEIAAEVTAHLGQKDIAVLRRILWELEKASAAPDPTSCIFADRSFHLYLARKVHNSILLRIVTELFDQRSNLLGKQFGAHFDNPKTWTAVVTEHRKIIEALAAHDSEQARNAMHSHLIKAHNRWAQQLENRQRPAVKRR